jgi:hypothetical protein
VVCPLFRTRDSPDWICTSGSVQATPTNVSARRKPTQWRASFARPLASRLVQQHRITCSDRIVPIGASVLLSSKIFKGAH